MQQIVFKTVFLLLQKRCQVEAEVRYLRDAISQLKVSISTITKGVSMSKIEVNIVSCETKINLNRTLINITYLNYVLVQVNAEIVEPNIWTVAEAN